MKSKAVVVLASLFLVCMFVPFAFASGGSQQAQPGTAAVRPTGPATNPMPIARGDVTLTLACADSAFSEAPINNNMPVWSKIESITGIKIDWQVTPQGTNYNEIMNVRLAAGSNLPDIMQLPAPPAGDPTKYASEGIIRQLDDLIAARGPNIQKFFSEYPVYKALMTSPDGKLYLISSIIESNEVNAWVPVIRMDWLKKVNLPVPKTFDEFYNMLVAFKTKDPDGVGVNNIIAYGAYGGFGSSYFALANGYGLHLDQSGGWFPDANGKVQYEFLLPAFKDYLTFMNKLYTEKLIDQQLFQPTLAALESLITLNYIGGATVGSNPILKWDNIQQGAGHKTVDWDSITPPVKNASDKVFVEKRGGVLVGRRFSISRDCKVPELAIRWMDFVYASPEGVMMANYGIEGDHYTMVNGKPKFTDYIMKHPKGWAPLPATRSTGAQTDIVQFNHINGYLDQLGSQKQINHVKKFEGMFIDRFPSLIATAEESRTVTSTMPEINTYRDEMIEKFVTGKEPLANFDRFVSTVRGMGIDRAIAVYQAQYDRYVKAMK